MPSFKIIGLLVLEKIFKGFYHIWACRPSWSCDLDHLYKLSFPFPRKLHIKFGFDRQSGFRGEDVWTLLTTTTTDARVRVYYKLTLWARRLRWAKNGLCAQWRLSSAWASAQSDQYSQPTWRNIGFLAIHKAQWRLWSDWVDAQADMSLRWAHMPFCWFCPKNKINQTSRIWKWTRPIHYGGRVKIYLFSKNKERWRKLDLFVATVDWGLVDEGGSALHRQHLPLLLVIANIWVQTHRQQG